MAYSEEIKKQVLELLAEKNFSEEDITFEMGISISTIRRWQKEAELKTKHKENLDQVDAVSSRDKSVEPDGIQQLNYSGVKGALSEKNEVKNDAKVGAKEKYKTKLEQDPKNFESRARYARILINQGELQEAKTILDEGVRMDPDNLLLMECYAKIARKENNKVEMFKVNSRIIQLEPNHLDALMRLFYLAKDDEKKKHATQIQKIIHDPEKKEELARWGTDRIKKIDNKTRKYLEEGVLISEIRSKIGSESISVDEGKKLLKELDNLDEEDEAILIYATVLKAKIYASVYGNPDKALAIIKKSIKQTAQKSKARAFLHDAESIITGFKKRGTSLQQLGKIGEGR